MGKVETLDERWERECQEGMDRGARKYAKPGTAAMDKRLAELAEHVRSKLVNCSNWLDLLLQRAESEGTLDDATLGAVRQAQWRMKADWKMLVARFPKRGA